MTACRVIAFDCSPSGGGRTARALEAVLDASRVEGATGERIDVTSEADVEAAVDAITSLGPQDAVVFGTPIYRATYAFPMKALLDAVPRDFVTGDGPLRARVAGIVATGASLHHFLGLGELRNVLSVFFAAVVVPPGLYVPRDGFTEDGLTAAYETAAATLGGSIVELAAAVAASSHLSRLTPQA